MANGSTRPRRGWGSTSPPSRATWPTRASTRSSSTTSASSATAPTRSADTNLPNTQSFRLPAIQRVLRVVSQRAAPHARLPRRGRLPDQLHRRRRPGDRAAAGGDHAVRRLLLPHGLPEPLRARRVRLRDPERPPLRRDQQHAEDHELARQPGSPCRIRPWIQDFGYGSFAPYTASQILAEKKAAADNDTSGWMTWNARATSPRRRSGPRAPGEDSGR